MGFFIRIFKKLLNNNGLVSLIDQSIVSAVNFITGFFLARFLSIEEYGAFTLTLSILFFLNGIQNALFITPFTIISKDYQEHRKKYMGETTVIYFLFIVVIILLMIFVYYIFPMGYIYRNVLIGVIITILFIQGQEFFRRVLFSNLLFRKALINDSLCYGVRVIGLIILLALGELNLLNTFLVMAFSGLLGMIIGYLDTKIYIQFQNIDIKSSLKINWNFGKWLLGNNIFAWVNTQIYIFVASSFLGPSAPARLSATQNLLNPTNILMQGLQNYYLPLGVEGYKEKGIGFLKQFIHKYLFIISSILIFYSLLIDLNASKLLYLLYGNKYSGSEYLLFLWSIAYIVTGFSRPYMLGLNILKKPRTGFFTYMIISILSIMLVVPIIKLLGAEGMIYWSIFTGIIIFLINFIIYKREIKIIEEGK